MLDGAHVQRLTRWVEQDRGARFAVLERALGEGGERAAGQLAADARLPAGLSPAEVREIARATAEALLGQSYDAAGRIASETRLQREVASSQRSTTPGRSAAFSFVLRERLSRSTPDPGAPSVEAGAPPTRALAALEDKLGRGRARVYAAAFGEEHVTRLANALTPADVKRVLEELTPETVHALGSADAAQIPQLLDALGAEALNRGAPVIGGAGVVQLLDALGPDAGAAVIMRRSPEKLARLVASFSAEHRALGERPPLEASSLVIDTNTALSLAKRTAGDELHAGERAQCAYIDARGVADLRITNVTIGEIAGRDLPACGVPLLVRRDSPEYRAIFAELTRENVGTAKGGPDRGILTDIFFAQTATGALATLATQDRQVYNSMARLGGIDVGAMGAKTIPDLYPDGFEVTLRGRTIRIVPIKSGGARDAGSRA